MRQNPITETLYEIVFVGGLFAYSGGFEACLGLSVGSVLRYSKRELLAPKAGKLSTPI
jgi:hypothetical protein